jgi:DNA polymerase-1
MCPAPRSARDGGRAAREVRRRRALCTDSTRSKPALKKTLAENRELALLSRELVSLHADVPLEKKVSDLVRRPADPVTTRRLFQHYEFRSLLDRVPDAGAAAPAAPVRDYRIVRGGEELRALLRELAAAPIFTVDTETTGIDPLRCELVGISLSCKAGAAAYLPFRQPGEGLFSASSGTSGIEKDPALADLRALLADPKHAKAGQNAKYDLHVSTPRLPVRASPSTR